MALANCLECNKQISTSATCCPNCGMVLKADNNIVYDKDKFFIVGSTLIKYIGGNADTIIIPEGVKSIGTISGKIRYFYTCSVFDHGTDINKIILPKSLVKIGDNAFGGVAVNDLIIPRNVKTIGPDAFLGCKNLKKIVFENPNTIIFQSETDIGGREDSHWIKNNIFKGCTILDEVIGHHFAISQLNAYKIERERKKNGCYIATAVYGSYDCPQVWTLRRYRDYVLSKKWYGRLFIFLYYSISPSVVELLGDTKWFNKKCKNKLDYIVDKLRKKGFESTPYEDNN